MKYQALKGLKTKTKLLKMCDTLAEADRIIRADGGEFKCFSYIGGFPSYVNDKNQHYNIQGYVPMDVGGGVVCSLDKKELAAFTF